MTGGGAFNQYLMESINAYCNQKHTIELFLPDASIINFKEAVLMALLGVMRMEKVPNSLQTITGAQKDTINGAIYQGSV